MTIKELAETAGVSVDTITRQARTLFPAKFEKGKKTIFSQGEAIEIMKLVRKIAFVGLPQSAEQLPQSADVRTKRLPSGIQMAAMIKAYGAQEAGKRFDFCLGYQAHYQKKVEEPKAPIEQGQLVFDEIRKNLK